MPEINDGGPAYPHPDYLATGHHGMSLRDHFAGQALPGLMGRVWNENGQLTGAQVIEMWAQAAYGVADAMLRARDSNVQDPQGENHG